jgi:MFS family permease
MSASRLWTRVTGLSRRRRFLVLAICCASMVVVVMDISIVNVALPAMRRDLHASVSGLQWTVDAYTLVLASFLMLAGSTADRVGRRRVFQIGLAAFGLGSLLCGLAPSSGWLIAARALQAVGGTMLNPVSMAIIANTFSDPAERARAIGVFGSMSGLSLALGPILGGALVDALGWRSIFWVNVPIVVAAIVCTALFVPESRAPRARRFDPVGQILVILVLSCVVYAIIESRGLGWTSPVIIGLFVVAALAVLGILGYEPRRADPLLELRLFRSVPFSSAILMALFALCGFGAFLFVTTQYLQDVRGMSALTAGLCLLPVGVLTVVISPSPAGWSARAVLDCRWWSPGPRWRWAAARRSGSDRPPRCRPCSRSTCCSASSWAPSTRRSPTRRSPECPARWPGWPPRWPPPAGRPAPPWASRSPERSWDRPWPAAGMRTPARSTACGGWCSGSASASCSWGCSAPGAGPWTPPGGRRHCSRRWTGVRIFEPPPSPADDRRRLPTRSFRLPRRPMIGAGC